MYARRVKLRNIEGETALSSTSPRASNRDSPASAARASSSRGGAPKSLPTLPPSTMITRFSKAFIFTIFALFLLGSLALLHPPSRTYVDTWTGDLFGEGGMVPLTSPDQGVKGNVIMPKLGNATAKAELGRATWKLMHTMTLRFPEEPTQDERDALNNYFHLMSRLYPCGECAAEFQQLLKKFPPQTSSRRAAATWLCVLHNQVNHRLGKEEFDCANLDATYDCGCGDEPLGSSTGSASDPMDLERDPTKEKVAMGLVKGGRALS